MSREGMSKIPKILTTKRKGLQALLLLLLQSEKIRFWRRFQGKIIYREFVQIFLVTFLELSRREGSLLLPWPFSNQVFSTKNGLDPLKRRQNLLPKVRRLVIYCPPAFWRSACCSRLNQDLDYDLEKTDQGKFHMIFFSHPKIFFMVGIPTFQAHVSIFKVAVKSASYPSTTTKDILTAQPSLFLRFSTP